VAEEHGTPLLGTVSILFVVDADGVVTDQYTNRL
jgi:hypothetical protein